MKYAEIDSKVRDLLAAAPTKEQLETMFLEVEADRQRLLRQMNEGPGLEGIDRVIAENEILRAWIPAMEASK